MLLFVGMAVFKTEGINAVEVFSKCLKDVVRVLISSSSTYLQNALKWEALSATYTSVQKYCHTGQFPGDVLKLSVRDSSDFNCSADIRCCHSLQSFHHRMYV